MDLAIACAIVPNTQKHKKNPIFLPLRGAVSKRTMSVFFSLTHMSESFPERVRMFQLTFQCNTCKEKLPIEQKYHGRMCKECKKAKSRNATAKKREAKQDAKKARFVTAQDWWDLNVKITQTNSKYLLPKKEEFASIEAFEEAMVRHRKREVEGGLGRQSARQYQENANSVKREVYSAMKTTEEGRDSLKKKQQAGDEYTRKRKEAALESGLDWCAHGSHPVPKQEMIFCPVEDLELTRCIPGRTRHHACKRHFEQYIKFHHNRDRSTPHEHLNDAKKNAKRRGLKWSLSESTERKLYLKATECGYCAQQGMHGVDRVDSNCTEYRDDNIVPCCSTCNYAKGGLSPDDFVQQCNKIVTYQKFGIRATSYIPYKLTIRKRADVEDHHNTKARWEGAETYDLDGSLWKKCTVLYRKKTPLNQMKYDAETRRGKKFEIGEGDFNAICRRPCTFCGLVNEEKVGIDRIDNEKDYLLDNIQSCCTTCNFMRRGLTCEAFLAKVNEIVGCKSE